jgi:hypothetical protein
LRSTIVGKSPKEDVINLANRLCFANGGFFIDAEARSFSAYRHEA